MVDDTIANGHVCCFHAGTQQSLNFNPGTAVCSRNDVSGAVQNHSISIDNETIRWTIQQIRVQNRICGQAISAGNMCCGNRENSEKSSKYPCHNIYNGISSLLQCAHPALKNEYQSKKLSFSKNLISRCRISDQMLCLGIESTAHTFGAAVVTGKGKILSNVRDLYTTESGGLIPAKVAIHHVDCCAQVVRQALLEANITAKDIDLISFSQSPGIGHCLRIGCMAAKSLALQLAVPLIGVNHCIAHLEIGRLLCKAKDPVMLYVSGANTQVIAYEAGLYRIFGETLDIGVGNFLDAFARTLNLGFPGGPKIE